MLFGRDSPNVLLNVKGVPVESKDSMKALGVQIDKGLTWQSHISSLKKRIMKVIGGVRMIRNKLTPKQATSVVTAQIFSVLYYACCVWLTPVLSKKCLNTIEGLHFKSLRLILENYRQRVSRDLITIKTRRLSPKKWSKFSLASLFLNNYNRKQPATLLEQFTKNFYEKRRKPKQRTRNWIGSAIEGIKSPWNNQTLSKDSVRVLMKKTYYVNESD